jgi:hypothetical protein
VQSYLDNTGRMRKEDSIFYVPPRADVSLKASV